MVLKSKSSPSNYIPIILFCFFLFSSAVRFLFAFCFRHAPTVQIDESLYINIAKSLAAGEGIAYRSQPIPYMYIFYPLLLTPLYLFPLPFDLYRVVQLYNSFLISSAVFPVYLFAKDFTGSRKRGLVAAALTLLMPDMMMAGFLMSECLVWPLSLWVIFFAYRLFRGENNIFRYGILTGIVTALLFWTKPGAVACGLALLLSAVFLKNGKQKTAAFAGLGACALFILFFYGLYTIVFGYEFSLLGLYNKQLTEISAKWFAAVSEFSLLQLLLFAIACGGLFFGIPFIFRDQYNSTQKTFLDAFSVALVVTAVGTAAFVDMHTWNGSFTDPQLHLRYMAMYVPVMVVFTLGITALPDKRKLSLISLVITAFLMAFPGASAGFSSGASTYMDSIALSAWISDFGVPGTAGVLLTAFTIFFIILISIQLYYKKASSLLIKESVVFLVLFLLANNICGYIACGSHKDKNNYGQDAVEMNTIVESLPQDILIVTQHNYDETVSYLLESRLRKQLQQVTVDAFMESLIETNGVYLPFVPADQSPNVGNHITPDTDTFLFGITVLDHLELSSGADIQKTGQGWFTLAQVSNHSRIADTVFTGLDMDTLHEGEQAHLYIFDDSRFKNGKLTLHLAANAVEGSAELEVENAGKIELISLTEKQKTCLISLKKGNTAITAHNGDIYISSYWTK